jgi:inorganic pyrophosphatase
MLNLWHDLPAGMAVPECVTAVIEIPSGSRNKYELDKASGMLKLDRRAASPPFTTRATTGFIPADVARGRRSLGRARAREGGDLSRLPDRRAADWLCCKMLDRGEPDDKILGVPQHDPFQQEYFDIADISQHLLKEVEHFFRTYKDLEGKRVEIIGWGRARRRRGSCWSQVARLRGDVRVQARAKGGR